MKNPKYEAFITAAKLGSFKKTADTLGYTQAGISYMLNSLEEEIDMKLFIRDYGGVRLTSEAQQLLPYIQDVYNSEYRLNVKVDELKNLDSGVVKIAAFASTAIHWLPGIMEDFMKEHPHIELNLCCCEDPEELDHMVLRGDVDCGFCILPTKTDLHVIPLKKDPLLVILPENHLLANEKVFPMSALSEYPYIRLNSASYSEFDSLFDQHGIKPHVYTSIENDYAVMAMVSKGFGFSIFPELFLQDIPFPLVCKELEIPADREIAIACRSEHTLSAAAKNFIECTEKWVKRCSK